ncbi:Kelch-type beta propeller [Macrophomina phaseolina MS6]|uniref:Kelch-type beta propeller n=1 Tax=Macrophomina phaseolina (strain MS6) TaxID=1126212 RepID=K2R8R4_MACPH|nr:Kelch-type beta propeller [Macrophomina phaseolina MS6]
MCARWEHQSVLKGNALYIDGGLETTYDGDERWTDEFFLGLNYYLLAIDMSASWNWGKNLTTTIHNKSASTPLQPPTVLRGHLFQGLPSDPHIYLYGGADFASNTSAHTPPSGSALWSYDTSSPNNTDWQRTDISDAVPRSPTRGARAEAPDLGLAFYLNGETGSVPSIAVWGNLSTQAAHVDGMVVLDTANATGRSAWNVSTAAMTQGQPRAGAGMTFVPAMGEKGALVLVGGMARAAAVLDDPGSGELIDLSQIQIFDLASWLNNPSDDNAGTWYAQPASGDVPALRTDFCLVAASAPDGSSHNVYLYGGRNPKSGTIYDDFS